LRLKLERLAVYVYCGTESLEGRGPPPRTPTIIVSLPVVQDHSGRI